MLSSSKTTWHGIAGVLGAPEIPLGYELNLISKAEFDKLANNLTDQPYLIKMQNGKYALWGYKEKKWQFTKLEDHFQIPPDWMNEKKVYVSCQTDIFQLLDKDHASSVERENIELINNMMTRGGEGTGLDIKRMRPYDYKVYSARRGGKSRILLIEAEVGEAKYAYLLEEDPEHNQREKSVYLKQKDAVDLNLEDPKVIKFIQTQVQAIIQGQQNCVSSSSSASQPDLRLKPTHLKRDRLSVQQLKALAKETPCIYRGGPGTGKTVAMLEWLYREAKKGKTVLYITKNEDLKKEAEQEIQEKYPDVTIRCCTYKELLEEQESKTPHPRKVMSQERYRDWLKSQLHNSKLTLTLEDLERELRVCSGYSEEEYVGTDEEAGLGIRQSNYGGEENKAIRKIIYGIKNNLMIYQQKHHVIHENFTRLKLDKKFGAVGYDEAHDGSLLQIDSVLTDTAEDYNVVINYDKNQKSYDQVDNKEEYLKKKMPQILGRSIQEQLLTEEFRSAYWICELTNRVQYLINRRSIEQEGYLQANPEIEGDVQWLKASEENKKEIKDFVSKSNDFIIITPEEYKAEAIKEFGAGAVFTPEEYKGRGFKNVILYRFFDSKRWGKTLEEINTILEGMNLSDEDAVKQLFKEVKNRGLENKDIEFLKEFLIAVSRGKETVLIYQKYHNKFKYVFEFLRCGKKELDKVEIEKIDFTLSMAKDSYEFASRLDDKGHVQQAKGKLREYLKKKKFEETKETIEVSDAEVNKAYAELRASKEVNVKQDENQKANNSSSAEVEVAIITKRKKNKKKKTNNNSANNDAITSANTQLSQQVSSLDTQPIVSQPSSSSTAKISKNINSKNTDPIIPIKDNKEKESEKSALTNSKNKKDPTTPPVDKIINYLLNLLESFKNPNIAKQNLIKLFNSGSDKCLQLLFEKQFSYNNSKPQTLFSHIYNDQNKKLLFLNVAKEEINDKNEPRIITLFPDNLSTKSKMVHLGINLLLLNDGVLAKNMCAYAIIRNNTSSKSLAAFLIKEHSFTKNELETLFLEAAKYGCVEIVNLLLQKGVDINCVEIIDNNTALHLAAYNGKVTTVELFLKNEKIKINELSRLKQTPINCALGNNVADKTSRLKIVELLLKKGAEIATKGAQTTPLHLATANGDTAIMQLLLKVRNINIDAVDINGKTAMYYASLNNKTEIIKQLEDHKKKELNDKEILKNIKKLSQAELNALLLLYATEGNEELVPALLENGAEISHVDEQKRTPLLLAAREGHVKIVELLLKDANIKFDAIDRLNNTPLLAAAANGHVKIVDMLIEKGADVNHQGYAKRAPLHWAAEYGFVDVAKSLMKSAQLNLDITDINRHTPMVLATKNNNTEVIHVLVQNKSRSKVFNQVLNQVHSNMSNLYWNNQTAPSQSSSVGSMFFANPQVNNQNNHSDNRGSVTPTANPSSTTDG